MGLFSGMFSGKSNRPDFTPDMMPKNRFELFFEMLKLNLFNLLKVNLMYFVFWIPFWIWTWMNLNVLLTYDSVEAFAADGYMMVYAMGAALCVMITGPAKCALKYITRNYARDEHVWLWSDFIGAIKANWKQGLALSVLNGLFLFLFVYGLSFYNNMAAATGSYVYLFLQVLLVVLGVMFLLMNLYAWPMMVTYELKFTQILRNSLVLAIGRLPQSVLFGLITIIPIVISGFWLPFLFWYFIIGYALASFVNCSYTNAAFDRFFNTRIEGAEVGRGMQKKAEDDDEWEDLDPDDEDDK
ncbi:MAG: DUF624 domain-containing protein [Candidatus Spyradocola sp.]|nr:DUF624 domain-containing protein [Candidatus Spyradocola sp.]